jgi:hypothetical protein
VVAWMAFAELRSVRKLRASVSLSHLLLERSHFNSDSWSKKDELQGYID